MHNFKKLHVYHRAIELSSHIWNLTEGFPPTERFGLADQFKRAGYSIALNIAEGSGASSEREFARFIQIGIRSGYECIACMDIARKNGFLPEESYRDVYKEIDEVIAMLSGLRNTVKEKGT